MKNVEVPKYHDFFDAVLQSLKDLGGSGTNQEIYEKVTNNLGMSDEVLDVLHNEGPMTKVEYRLRWTQTYLKKDGAITNHTKGVWTLLPRGKEMSDSDISGVRERVKKLLKEERTKKKKNTPDLESSEDLAEDILWNIELLDILKAMDPSSFERLSQRLLRESGFVRVQVTGKSGDGGIDGVGVLRMNLVSFQVMFQCKRYKGSVSSPAVRDFRGAMTGRTDKGLIITTGTFTSDAKREAVRDGAPTIDLIDGDALCELLKNLKMGVRTKLIEEIEIDSDFFKLFD